MIVVTGATGQLGRAIVYKLVEHVPASQIAVSVHDVAKAAELQELGIRVRHGDFAHPETLANAFEGANRMLMVSSNAAAYGGDPLAQHRAAINAARGAGVTRIVYTSHMSTSADSAFPPARDHAATEAMLAASGLAWTALRNGFYASSGLFLIGDAPISGVIEAPEDGKVSWTAHDDLAAAAAIILASPTGFDGPTPPLTGSDALDLADVAAILTDLLGRPVRRETITDDELVAKMSARGAPPSFAKTSLGLYRASRAGEFSAVDVTLEHLLGHPPIAMRDLVAAKVASSLRGHGHATQTCRQGTYRSAAGPVRAAPAACQRGTGVARHYRCNPLEPVAQERGRRHRLLSRRRRDRPCPSRRGAASDGAADGR